VLLRANDDGLKELGRVPTTEAYGTVNRSLVIGDTVYMLSDHVLQANSPRYSSRNRQAHPVGDHGRNGDSGEVVTMGFSCGRLRALDCRFLDLSSVSAV
jgi:hypothetical protein